MDLRQIVSGGQTGADRAALDAALKANFPCGGWCPEGRLAEDGPLSPVYPLQELPGAGYRQRTIKHIDGSDGTAIFYFTQPVGGTELTLVQCIKLHKPYQLIDCSEVSAERATAILVQFVHQNGIATLNVAGPSATRSPGIHSYVECTIGRLIETSRNGA